MDDTTPRHRKKRKVENGDTKRRKALKDASSQALEPAPSQTTTPSSKSLEAESLGLTWHGKPHPRLKYPEGATHTGLHRVTSSMYLPVPPITNEYPLAGVIANS